MSYAGLALACPSKQYSILVHQKQKAPIDFYGAVKMRALYGFCWQVLVQKLQCSWIAKLKFVT